MNNITIPGNNIKNLILKMGSLKSGWTGKLKLSVFVLVPALTVLIFIFTVLYLKQHTVLKEQAYNEMSVISDEKAARLEEYFDYLEKLITSFASEPSTLEAMTVMSEAFGIISNEVQYSPESIQENYMVNDLRLYYNSEVLPVLEEKTGRNFSYDDFAGSSGQSVLQYLYISDNERQTGQKHLMGRASDNSTYSTFHGSWQPLAAGFAAETGVSDIYLADYKTGNIVYSYRKNIDFATNLYDGPFSNTLLARAFTGITAGPSKGQVLCTDMSLYSGVMMQPVFFLSTPVYEGNTLTGVLILAVGTSALDDIMNVNPTTGVRSFIAGDDLKLRSADRHSENSSGAVMDKSLDIPGLYGSDLDSGYVKYNDFTGRKTFASFKRAEGIQPDWIIFTAADKNAIFSEADKTAGLMLLLAVIFMAALCLVVWGLGNMIFSPLSVIAGNIANIRKGGAFKSVRFKSFPEIAAVDSESEKLASGIDEIVSFIEGLSNENFDVVIATGDGNDRIADTLINLRNKLIQTRTENEIKQKEEDIRNWNSESLALFNDILRSDHDNLEKLSLNIIRNLINKLRANQGGLFLIVEEDGRRYLNLEASVAFDRQKFHKKTIEIGEGLAGECVLEKQTILLNKVPDDYVHITSGLGGSRPTAVVIVPLKKDNTVMGLIEIASFNTFEPHEVEFLEKIAENITETIINVRLNVQNIQLVERFQQQAEEMKAQEEELRQNIEELRATHEQIEKMKAEDKARMDRMLKEMENNKDLLIHVLDNIPGKIFVKDKDGVLLLLNSEVARVYHKKVNEMIGTSDFDNHPYEQAKQYREKELEILARGGETYIQEETLTGEVRYLQTTKKPFHIPGTGETGLLGFQIDVTETRRLQDTVEKLKKEIARLKSV